MQHRGLTTALAVLAATVGLGTAASGAQAAVIAAPVIDNDSFLLIGTNELALTDGNMAFSFSNGTITPRLTATLEGQNADDLCVRARIDSYEGATLLHSTHSKKLCLKNDQPYAFPVDFSEAPDARTDNVTVAIEKKSVQGWTTVDDTAPGFLDVNTFTDSVRILGSGVDFGGEDYAGGNPTQGGFVSWPLDHGLVTPHVEGFIHFEGFSNCARIQMRVIGSGPLSLLLETVNGRKECPADLSHQPFPVTLDATATGSVNRVEIVLQTKNGGSWQDVDSQTVSIAN
jgi:hypothetical protein